MKPYSLDTTTGTPAFISYREKPWLGLGTCLEVQPSLAEAQKLAGLDFLVEKVPLAAVVTNEFGGVDEGGLIVPDTSYSKVSSHVATRRTDTGAILGIVGSDYTIVQNKRMFEVLADLSLWGELILETAGALEGGAKVWAQCRMDSLRWEIDAGDVLAPYLMISNGFDGKTSLVIAPMVQRFRCWNRMRMVMEEQKTAHRKRGDGLHAGWRIAHTSEVEDRIQEAKVVMIGTTDAWKATQVGISRLIEQTFDEGLLSDIVEKVWKSVDDAEDAGAGDKSKSAKTRLINRVGAIKGLLAAPTNTSTSAKGTLWGAYNAVTEYIDHDNTVRSGDGRSARETRFLSTTFGRGDRLKTKAWNTFQGLLKPKTSVLV